MATEKKKEKTLIEKISPITNPVFLCDLLNQAAPTERQSAEQMLLAKHNEWVLRLDNRVAKYSERLNGAEKNIKSAVSRLNAIEPDKVEQNFRRMDARVGELGERLALLITKTTVATEVPWMVRRIMDEKVRSGKVEKQRAEEFLNVTRAAVIRSFDYPDAWWDENGNKYMGQVLDALLEAYEKDVWAEYPDTVTDDQAELAVMEERIEHGHR